MILLRASLRALLAVTAALAGCTSSSGDGAANANPRVAAGVGGLGATGGSSGGTVASGDATGVAGALGGAGGSVGDGGSASGGAAVGGAGGAAGSSALGGTGGGGGGSASAAHYDFSAGDAQGYAGDVDFSPGRWKGACAQGEVMTGLSFAATCGEPRILQCAQRSAWTAHSATVSPYCADARRDESTGDWDAGVYKGECAATEALVGVARDVDGAVIDLACAELGAASEGPGACTVRNVNAGDNRGLTTTGDWDSGNRKAECAAGEYVKGVSLSPATRLPHAILCCTGGGTVSVEPALNPEPSGAGACARAGEDANITVFDAAHQTGASRYLYQTVTFPQRGSYERITMTLTLGCPPNGCDPWDRWGSVGIVLEKKPGDPGGDRLLELGRFVTPYGVGGTFTYDLTELRPALVGQKELRLFTDTWVDGWLTSVKIEMKGGTPAKEPAFVLPLWAESHVGVGVPSRPVSMSAPPRDVRVPRAACGLSVHAIITGHGQGNSDNCAEFCPKTHYFQVGGVMHGRAVWRDDCATSAVQNQHGTWQYARAGWCPGASVRALSVDIGGNVSADAKAGKAMLRVAYDVEGYDNSCRPDHCTQSSCVFGTPCAYDGGAHTEPFYALAALLVGYK